MARSEVVNAFAARLAAHWAETPVFAENREGETPNDGSPYLLVLWPYSSCRRISFGAPGANVYREEGSARLVLHIERGRGATLGRQWADALATLFLGQHFEGVETFAPISPGFDDDSDNGKYQLLPVIVPYRFDFLG